MAPAMGKLGYPLDIEELDIDESLRFDGYRIQTFATRHRGASLGYVFVEDDRPGRFDAERAAALGITPGPESASCSAARRCAGSSRRR